jgi:hypothetical protein
MAETARKAKLAPERARWLTFETAAFLCGASGAVPLDRGFPQRAPRVGTPAVAELQQRLARHRAYLAAGVQPDGLPFYAHEVERGSHTVQGSTTRLLFAAHALGDGGLQRFLAARDAGTVQRTIDWDLSCDALLLAALDELGDEALLARVAPDAVERLAALVHADGAIFEDRRIDGDLDFMSGTVLVALGTLDRRRVPSLDRERLARTFAFYRKRFELVSPWAMTWWHVAAWYAWRHALDTYAFVCELADFAVARQHRASGAFLTDYTDEPSFHTACVLEGLVTAWRFALERDDIVRAERYRDAWLAGQRFMETLTYDANDNYFLRGVSLDGGVRATATSANVRCDFVAHAIVSLDRGLRLLSRTP